MKKPRHKWFLSQDHNQKLESKAIGLNASRTTSNVSGPLGQSQDAARRTLSRKLAPTPFPQGWFSGGRSLKKREGLEG